MTEIGIKIEKLIDKDMVVSFYNFDSNLLQNEDPISELKTIETLANSLKMFEETKLYDSLLTNIRTRLARLLAFYYLQGEVDAVTNA